MPYDHQSLEKQWQQFWTEQKTFETENPKASLGKETEDFQKSSVLRTAPFGKEPTKPKKYILDMFPYPSGAGLHVGHPKGYTATDIVSRYYHAKGYNVLHPMGFDAFGLPAENYAIKTGTHPAVTTAENIATFTEQLQKLGFSYDWSRKVDTTDPEYYRWTQWIFLQLFERGLAYEQDLPINYCPSCKTGLANEEVHTDNTCDRCGTRVDRKKIRQWVLKITQYADRLLSDLDSLDWPDGIKEMQRNWIGRSEGCEFELKRDMDRDHKKMKTTSLHKWRCPQWTAKSSHDNSIFKDIVKVKKKNENLRSIDTTLHHGDKKIICNSDNIFKHFSGKSTTEFYRRKNLLSTVYPLLEEIVFENNIGYCVVDTLVVKVILGQQSNGNYFVKTYYVDDRATITYRVSLSETESEKAPSIRVYTTRIDTVYGMTYVVLAPDHPHVQDFITEDQRAECEKYILDSRLKSDQDRTAENKEKTGVFTGSYVINPYNGESVPLWIADYVLGSYGTGAVMAVPAHDERDFEFAKKYGLEIKTSISQVNEYGDRSAMYVKQFPGMNVQEVRDIVDERLKKYSIITHRLNDDRGTAIIADIEILLEIEKNGDFKIIDYYEQEYHILKKDGYLKESSEFNGLSSAKARQVLTEKAESEGFGQKKVNYKLRDWLFSRQRYWGEPIPLIHISREEYEKLPRIEGAEDTKKSKNSYSDESEAVAHNGNTAKYLLHSDSIFKYIQKVKKKNTNQRLSELYQISSHQKGDITFNGKNILEHFRSKTKKEVKHRAAFAYTIASHLEDIYFESDLVGYLSTESFIFRIIFERVESELQIKTYYVSQSYSRILTTAYIVSEKENEEYLYISGKPFSKIYEGINSKIIIDSRLPLTLPEVEKYEPAGDGQSPLATVDDWVNVKLAGNLSGKRETNTMPQWGGSCWYYLRYMDTMNRESLASREALDYWGMVDEYVGGAEHAVLHLLYARFWHKVLYDLGVVPTIEPFAKLTNVGLILAYAYERPSGGLVAVDLVESKDGRFFEKSTGEEVKQVVAKMSKSLKNVINPNDIVAEYGADTLRLYEMSMGAFTDSAPWNPEAIIGSRRFLDKIYAAFTEGKNQAKDDMKAMKLLHKTIKKVGEDIVEYKFNTAISSLIILMNEGIPSDEETRAEWKTAFLTMLHPFAPHMAEELYRQLTEKKKTLLILHGFGDTGGDHWASWVADQAKKMGYEVILPDIPYETGDMSACLDSLESYRSRLDTESVIIGHSMGNVLGLRFVESLSHGIHTFISVAGAFEGISFEKAFQSSPRMKEYETILYSLCKDTVDYSSVRKNIFRCVCITSDNDPLIDQTEQRNYFSTQGLLDEYLVLPGKSHFSTTRGGILELTEILPFLDSSGANPPSIYHAPWPEYDEWMLVDDEVNISIQVNGKLRGVYQFMNGVAQEEVSIWVREQAEIQKWLDGKELVKEIWIPNKMLSIVVR